MDIYPPVNYGPAAVYMGAVGRGGIFDVPIPTLDSHFFLLWYIAVMPALASCDGMHFE